MLMTGKEAAEKANHTDSQTADDAALQAGPEAVPRRCRRPLAGPLELGIPGIGPVVAAGWLCIRRPRRRAAGAAAGRGGRLLSAP